MAANPWLTTRGDCAYCCTEDRLARADTMTEAQLRAALVWPDTQKTVRAKIDRRLKKMAVHRVLVSNALSEIMTPPTAVTRRGRWREVGNG